jgi:hypothetical protein
MQQLAQFVRCHRREAALHGGQTEQEVKTQVEAGQDAYQDADYILYLLM